jgi:hypothetical protein
MDAQWATPLLLDAKREYAGQLAEIITPFVLDCVGGMHARAKGNTKLFRQYLREIPTWNVNVVLAKTNDIQTRVPYLSRLITAVFVAYTKVMSTIKLYDNAALHDINLNVPSNDQLVHKVFVHVASAFYLKPSLVLPEHHDFRRELVLKAVHKTVHELLPMQDILDACLPGGPAPQVFDAAVQQAPEDAEFFGGVQQEQFDGQQFQQPQAQQFQQPQPQQQQQQFGDPFQFQQVPQQFQQSMFQQSQPAFQLPQPQMFQLPQPQPQMFAPQLPQPQQFQPQPLQPQQMFQPAQPQPQMFQPAQPHQPLYQEQAQDPQEPQELFSDAEEGF